MRSLFTLFAGDVVIELLVPNPESAVLVFRPLSTAGLLPESPNDLLADRGLLASGLEASGLVASGLAARGLDRGPPGR